MLPTQCLKGMWLLMSVGQLARPNEDHVCPVAQTGVVETDRYDMGFREGEEEKLRQG